MQEALRSLVLLALAAAVLTAVAAAGAWWFEDARRLRRALKAVLKAAPGTEAVAPAQGRAAGIDFNARSVAVLWDKGDSGLVYGFDELNGAELIVDGQVAARILRDEPGRPLERLEQQAEQVALRLIFADPRWPEFELELWGERSVHKTGGPTPADAVRLGRKWLAHVDAVVKRRANARMVAAAPQPVREPESAPPPPPPPPSAPVESSHDSDLADDELPF